MADAFDLTPEQWPRLRRLLDEALALPDDARGHWLGGLQGEDAALGPRLAALLEHAQQQEGSVAALLATLPKVETGQFAPPPPLPERVGPYRLVRELGSGGMASVWLAEREDMLQRRPVALKLPHGAWRRAGLAERLAREREILATLEHPNIARLYDAGVAEDGQPWLALELVHGERIDAHCERHALDVPARLRLFVQAARAVAHAHAQLVVHRDLKPANILVSAAGEVKLLDFGIAKLLDQGLTVETELTRQAGPALTPEYAAPEQIAGAPVGTAADVYALGVVLYELLAGQRPYALRRGSRAALEEAIAQAAVAPPSARVPAARRRALRGDLDTIVLKALQREPARRYATAAAFAEDIERYLDHRPVLAQPDALGYRVARFVRRHRVMVGAGAAVVVALLAGTGLAAWQAVQARAEQRRAEEVLAFVTSIFRDADPHLGAQEKPSPAELLARARARVDSQFPADGATRRELLCVLAESFLGLQDIERADEAARAALAAAGGPTSTAAQALRARSVLARVQRGRGATPAMRAELEFIEAALRPVRQRDPAAWVRLLNDRAELELDEARYEVAEATGREALAWMAQRPGDWEVPRVAAWHVVASGLEARQRYGEAAEAAEQAYRQAQAAHPGQSRHPSVVNQRLIYARTLAQGPRFREGIALMQQAVADTEALYGPRSRPLGQYLQNLAVVQTRVGDLDGARRNAQRAVALLDALYGPRSGHAGAARDALAFVHFTARENAAAVALYDEVLRTIHASMGRGVEPEFPVRLRRAAALAWQGAPEQALPELNRVAEEYRRVGRGSMTRPWHHLGIAERLAGRPAAALDLQQRALQAVRDGPNAERERLPVRAEIGLALVELGRHREAIELLEPLLAEWDRQLVAPVPARVDAAVGLGRAYLGVGAPARALEPLRSAAAYWRAHDPGGPWAREAQSWLDRAQKAAG